MYYLQSRYYNPELGRFINADAFVSTGQGLLGNNMFAYCRNNPVLRIDISGKCDLEQDSVNVGDEEDQYKAANNAGGADSSQGDGTSIAVDASVGSATAGTGNTTIYRYGYKAEGASKLVPSQEDVSSNSGLSFSTRPRSGAAMTSIDEVNSTGVLFAVQDGATHVSVYPIGGSISEWRSAGVNSLWTQALTKIVRLTTNKEWTLK